MNDEMQKQILARIDLLAQKLGLAANQIWEMFLRQSYINGIENAVLATILFVIAIFLGMFGVKLYKNADTDGEIAGACAIFFIVMIVCCVAINCTVDSIDYLVNPQLKAFEAIYNCLR
jgi:hypothetical protein